MADNVIRTITIRGSSEGLDKLTAQLKELAAAEQGLAVVSDDLTKSQISLEAQLKRQNARLDENVRRQNTINREISLSERGVRQKLKTDEEHAKTIELVNQRYAVSTVQVGNLTKASSRAGAEMLNLSRQVADVGVSLQAGQSPFTVLVQQGAQIIDVFAASNRSVGSFFGQAAGWAGRFAASAGGVATGIAAIAGGAVYMASSWVSAQKDIEKALSGVGSRSLATAGDINDLAEANAKSSRLSVSESREAALEFVKTGNIQKDNIIALTGLVDGFAKTVNKSSTEAAQDLAKMFSGDVIGAAKQLDAIYGTASSSQLQYIRNLEIAGQRQQAIAETVRVFEKDIKNASDQTGFWAASWNSVSNAASNAADAIGKALSKQTGIGQGTEERLESLKKEFEMLQENARIRQDVRVQRGESPIPAFNERTGLSGAAGAGRIRQVLAELAEAEAKAGKGAEDLGKQFGKAGDDAVRSLLPHIEQLEKVDKLISDIKNAQEKGTGRALGGFDKDALNAAEILKDKIKQVADETARANANGLQLKETYGTTTVEAARTLDTLKDQANVAGAVGGAARMAAEEQARYNQLIREGKDAQDATRIAAAERKVTQDGINAGAKETLWNLQNQEGVLGAVGGKARMIAQEQATYNKLVHDGVDKATALKIAEQERANTQTQINAKSAEATWNAKNMLPVAEAVGGAARMAAQEQATYNKLVFEGVSPQQAAAQASAERAVSQAQVNSNAKETLLSLKDQSAVASAITGSDKISAQAQATKNQLLRAGVESSIAMQIAATQEGNARAEVTSQVYQQVHLLNQSTELIYAQFNGTQANVKAQQAYTNAIRAGADEAAAAAIQQATYANESAKAWVKAAEAMARMVDESNRLRAALSFVPTITLMLGGGTQDLFQSKQGGYSQFKTEGYESPYEPIPLALYDSIYGRGGYDPVTKAPNAQGREFQFNKAVGSGGMASAVGGLLSQGVLTEGALGAPPILDTDRLGILQRAIEVLPKEQQIGATRQLVGQLESAPPSLATSELIKQLNDKLEQLTKATDANTDATSAMTDVLSPFYSSDPRRTHLGFRAFAEGGIMTEYGALPLRQYQGGGMATSPQVAVFGEGSTPEAYVPVPSGRIPVEIKQPANSNQRPVNVNIIVHGNADANTVAALKATAFQQAQSMRRVMR